MTTTRFLLTPGVNSRYSNPSSITRLFYAVRKPFDGCRHASTTPPKGPSPKPKLLEKPTQSNPPSHSARPNRKLPRQYGPSISPKQREEQKKKHYPNMMPPKGSFMYWFLTNRSIHVWITLSTLFSLAFYTMLANFHRTSPFSHLLPRANTFLSDPVSFVSQYLEVYKLHTAHISAETAERRRKRLEDVEKRRLYRKAHGLEKAPYSALKDESRESSADQVAGTGKASQEATYVDWERKRRPVKRWFGIWE